ncbi:MAG: type II toxin-antitoxin system VapC family toxin [Spirochaetales bacterium]|nr:type II toxin-antitoxin system VapC family toxin [Spirochaetales bacterium]
MIMVLDVSGAIEILFQKEKKVKYDETYKQASWVIAPDLYVSEISNVLWKYYRSNLFSHEECIQYAEDGINMVDDFIDAQELWKEALGEGIKNNHSIYDMYYLVLARRNDATLITNDNRLVEFCKKFKITYCY